MKKKCASTDLCLKSFFLGPQSENQGIISEEINYILNDWFEWRKGSFPEDGRAISISDQKNSQFNLKRQKIRSETRNLTKLFSREIPKYSPRYLGHMFSEISIPSILGHFIALLHNPNNISSESSWVGVDIEKAAISFLSKMIGYSDRSPGHFTSGGTIANFEAVIRAKKKIERQIINNASKTKSFTEACYLPLKENTLTPDLSEIELYHLIKKSFNSNYQGPALLVPDSKHYSWIKAASLLGIGRSNLITVELNKYGQICTQDLKRKVSFCIKEDKPIISLTSVFGSTELGTIDAIYDIDTILKTYQKKGINLWHHVDAAYGGFFACLKNSKSASNHLLKSIQTLKTTQSITIDPHKLGYIPYSAGVFICRSPQDYYLYSTTAPYVDFKAQKDPGPYTIEGSRSATGAAAMYVTARSIGLNKNGYGKILERTLEVAKKIKKEAIKQDLPLLFVKTAGTNIVCFAVGKPGDSLTKVNRVTKKLLTKISSKKNRKNSFFVSKTHLNTNYKNLIKEFSLQYSLDQDTDELHLIRLTVMNPFMDNIHSKVNYISEFINYLKLSLNRH